MVFCGSWAGLTSEQYEERCRRLSEGQLEWRRRKKAGITSKPDYRALYRAFIPVVRAALHVQICNEETSRPTAWAEAYDALLAAVRNLSPAERELVSLAGGVEE